MRDSVLHLVGGLTVLLFACSAIAASGIEVGSLDRSLDIHAYPPGQAPQAAYERYRNPPPDWQRVGCILAPILAFVAIYIGVCRFCSADPRIAEVGVESGLSLRLRPAQSGQPRCAWCHAAGGSMVCMRCGSRLHDACAESATTCPTLGCDVVVASAPQHENAHRG